MLLPKIRLVALALIATAWPLSAQVHEADESVELTKGLVLKAEAAKAGTALAGAAETRVGAKDFALAMTINLPTPLSETVLAGQGDDAQGWRLLLMADGAFRFEARVKGRVEPFAVTTAPGAVEAGGAHHIGVNIVRDAARPNSGIWLDGVELASGLVPPVDLNSPQPLSVGPGAGHIRLYQRSLSRPELMALWLEGSGRGATPVAKHPAPPANGPRFIPQPGETIALIGGTEAVALAESGELEAMLLMAFPESRFHFRSLAWEGDTVFRQDRPMNFGDLEQQLRRVNAGTVFVMFGRQECLEAAQQEKEREYGGAYSPHSPSASQYGKAASGLATHSRSFSETRLVEFKTAFGKLLDTAAKVTPNIVIVSPPMFHLGVLGARSEADTKPINRSVSVYRDAMRQIATERGLEFVDATRPRSIDGPPRSTDGVNLTRSGIVDVMLSVQIELALPGIARGPHAAGLTEGLMPLVKSKNRLWHDYWRPTNWAFLHGDRTQQPSSRDHVNPQLRFFPAEQEKYLPLIKDAEEKVYKLVEEATKKLP